MKRREHGLDILLGNEQDIFMSSKRITQQNLESDINPQVVEFFKLLAELAIKYAPEVYEDN